MAADIFTCLALQLLFIILPIVLFGFLVWLCNRCFYSNFKEYGRAVVYVTGIIGVPVHELSHALLCVVFRHSIKEIKFFQIGSADGTLGYVRHAYNPRSIYQRIGNFFIGVAPIIVITLILYAIAYYLLPQFISGIDSGASITVSWQGVANIFVNIGIVLKAFFMSAASWQWWVFVLISMFLTLHMTLSLADVKGALAGIISLTVGLLVLDFLLRMFGSPIVFGFTQWVIQVSNFMICLFVLALIISLFAVAISFIFRFGKNLVDMRRGRRI